MNFADLSEISAEMLLNRLYPELTDQWQVSYAGTFYRNYSNDAMMVDEESRKLTVARDGWLKLVPAGLLSDENELREGNFSVRNEKMNERVELLREQFLPFDSFAFRRRLHLEREINRILEEKELFILKQWFGIDWDSLTDPLVRELARLLPYLKGVRGNVFFVRDLLRSLLDLEVKLHRGMWSATDTTRSRIPWLRYEIIKDGMTAEEFLRENEAIAPAADFIREWLLPAEVRCDISYKSFRNTEENPILDYNSILA